MLAGWIACVTPLRLKVIAHSLICCPAPIYDRAYGTLLRSSLATFLSNRHVRAAPQPPAATHMLGYT